MKKHVTRRVIISMNRAVSTDSKPCIFSQYKYLVWQHIKSESCRVLIKSIHNSRYNDLGKLSSVIADLEDLSIHLYLSDCGSVPDVVFGISVTFSTCLLNHRQGAGCCVCVNTLLALPSILSSPSAEDCTFFLDSLTQCFTCILNFCRTCCALNTAHPVVSTTHPENMLPWPLCSTCKYLKTTGTLRKFS